ncbi:MAG: LuxR C-terminal-related transcriptional regulator [Chitinophagales bacterium]
MGATPPKGTSAERRLPLLLWSLTACLLASGFYFALQDAPVVDIGAYAQQMAGQAANRLRSDLDKYDNLSFQFVANRDLNKLLEGYVRAKDNYEVSLQNQEFANYLEGFAFGDYGIYDALFVDEANVGRKALTMGEAIPYGFVKGFPRSALYRDVVAADGRAVWSGALAVGDSRQTVVALGRRIKHLYTGRPLGVLVIFLRPERLVEAVNEFLKANFYFSVGTPRTNYTMLVGADDRIAAAALPGLATKPAGKVFHGSLQFRAVLPGARDGGTFTGRLRGEAVLVAYRKVKGTGWRLFVPVASSPAVRLIRRLRRFLVALAVGGAVLAAGVLLFKPFRNVTHGPAGLLMSAPPSAPEPAATIPAPEWLAALNEREREILRLLAQGHSNREIAAKLFVAEQTVKNYVSAIYHKMDVRDRVQASLKAIEAGLLRDGGT